MARNFGFEPVEKKPYYFISYNSNDASRVAPICVEMYRRGIPMWYDNGLIPGEEWEKQITLKIKNCNEMVMFVTQKLMEKENNYVRTEYKLANKFKKRVQIVFLDKIDFDKVNDALMSWLVGMESKHCVEAYDLRTPQEIVTVMDIIVKFDKRRLPGYMQLVPVPVPVSNPQPVRPLPAPQPIQNQPQQMAVQQTQPAKPMYQQPSAVPTNELLRKKNAKWMGIISIILSLSSCFSEILFTLISSFYSLLFLGLGWIMALTGLVLGAISVKKYSTSPWGLTGLILGIMLTIGNVFIIVSIVFLIFAWSNAGGETSTAETVANTILFVQTLL